MSRHLYIPDISNSHESFPLVCECHIQDTVSASTKTSQRVTAGRFTDELPHVYNHNTVLYKPVSFFFLWLQTDCSGHVFRWIRRRSCRSLHSSKTLTLNDNKRTASDMTVIDSRQITRDFAIM